MVLVPVIACQEPFSEDRHDLADFRIAGMRADAGGRAALLWAGAHPIHATSPSQAWSETSNGWSLVAEDADGSVETGLLIIEDGAENPDVTSFERTVEGDVASLSVNLDERTTTHWMAQGGEFAERDRHATDWTAPGAGIWPVLGFHFDGLGGNAWSILDVAVAVEPPWFEVGGRLIPTDATEFEGEGWWEATLAGDVDGVILTDVSVAAEGTAHDFDALIDGRTGFDEVVDTRVAFHGMLRRE